MAGSPIHNIISRIVEIKSGERKISILLFSYFFAIMLPYYIIKSVRDTNYLIEEGSLRLPIAYLLTAVIIGFVVAFHSKIQARLTRGVLIILSLIFFTITNFLFGIFFMKEWEWVPLFYWVWANVLGVVIVTQFFLLVNDVFNPREAKRLIGFLGAGGTLGGILGSLLTGVLAKKLPEIKDYLLFIASGTLFVSIFFVALILIWQRKNKLITNEEEKVEKGTSVKSPKAGFRDSLNAVKGNYYLKLMAAVVAMTFIVSTFVDYQNKSVINEKVDVDEMTSFFGFFNAALLVLSFLISLLLTSKFLKKFGFRFALLVLPLILLLCSLGIAVSTGLVFALVIKGSDKSLSSSLNQNVRELLYIPISARLKNRAKIFIDMLINKFARGIGAIILMIFLLPGINVEWDLRVKIVSIFSFVCIPIWIFLNLRVSREYTNTVKQRLELKWDRGDRFVTQKLDVDYTKLVFDLIESKGRSSVLYALHLFDLIKKDKLTPEIQRLISFNPVKMKPSHYTSLFDAEDAILVPEFDEQLSEEVLEKEVQEIMSLDVYKQVMKDHIGKVIEEKTNESETAKMELAKAIGFMEAFSPLVDTLEELLGDKSPQVARYAVESAARFMKREHIPAIIKILKSPFTREDACSALNKYGTKIVGTLADYLGDTQENIEMRKAVASILARLGTQEAADFLSWELAEDRDDMDAELIDALDKIRSENPGVQFSEKVIEQKVVKKLKVYYTLLLSLYDSIARREAGEKIKNFKKSLENIMRGIFDLLGLIYPREDIVKAYQNVKTGTKNSVAYAIELIDNMLKKEIKEYILPVIEDLTLDERVRRCRALLKQMPS